MTIHRVHKTDIPEINRVLQLIQKDILALNPQPNKPSLGTVPSGGGTSSGGTSIAAKGDKGDKGDPGVAGTANLDLVVMARTEEEEIIVTNSNDIVSDELGFAITGIKEQWSIVTDDNGNIL